MGHTPFHTLYSSTLSFIFIIHPKFLSLLSRLTYAPQSIRSTVSHSQLTHYTDPRFIRQLLDYCTGGFQEYRTWLPTSHISIYIARRC